MDPANVNAEMPVHPAEQVPVQSVETAQPIHKEEQEQQIVEQIGREVEAATGEPHQPSPDEEAGAVLRGVLIPPVDSAEKTHADTEAVVKATMAENYRNSKLRHIPLIGRAINWFLNLFGRKTASTVEHLVSHETRTGDSSDFMRMEEISRQKIEQTQQAALQQVPPAV